MTQDFSNRCYSMAERRAAGFPTKTPLMQYPETVFERAEHRGGCLALVGWSMAGAVAALAFAWFVTWLVQTDVAKCWLLKVCG